MDNCTVKAGVLILRLRDNATDEAEQDGSIEETLYDAAFHIPGSSRLEIKTRKRIDEVADFLDHLAYRTRGDLRCHVQRVYAHIRRRDPEAVYGALLDLFIILNERGRPLRKRMLETCCKRISEDRYAFLARHLDSGIREIDAVPPVRTSLLTKGISGINQLVIKQDTTQRSYLDPLAEALDHIEYGQLEEAKRLLEAAVTQQPHRRELHQELLDLYRHTKDMDSFNAMFQRLDMESNPAAEAWQDLADRMIGAN